MTTVVLAGAGGAAFGLGLVLLAPFWRTSAERLNGRARVPRQMLFRSAIVGTVGGLTWAVTGWPVAAVLAGCAAWWLPAVLAPNQAAKAEVAKIEAVAGWTEQLRDLISAASGLRQAVGASLPIAPAPIRPDVELLARDLTEGMELRQALADFAHRVDNETADLVVVALSMASHRHAADLGPLLGNLAEAARDRASLLNRTSDARAQTRTSVRIIIGASLVMVVGMGVFNGSFFEPLGTALGQMTLALVGALWAGALWWLVRLSNPPRQVRLLKPQPEEAAA